MSRRLFPALVAVGMIGACSIGGCSAHGDQPGAVTADEARQLNDAAAMLDANSVDANAVGPDANESDTQ